MGSFLLFLYIIATVFLLACKDNIAKLIGKIMLAILLIPVVGFILLFTTCLVVLGLGSIVH